MHIINNINAKTFSYNGRNYTKNFIAIKQGNTNIAIHNAYDTKFQLVGSTHFNQFQVNGVVYTSQADLMANLVNILFVKNLGAGAISNTSELINDGADGINPFVTTADLPSANKILNQTGYNLSGETLTINADWFWLIANQQYTNPAEVVINVPLASSGMTRIDLIVADNNNTFQRIAGTEAVDNAITPPVPNNTIQATLIVVTDGIIETEPTPVGDLYLEKLDEGIGYLGSSSGIMANFILKKYTNYIIQNTSSVTQINSASFLSPVFSYVGKRIRITNQQSTPIVFKHNFGIGVLQFDLINNTDYILGTDETINFIVQDDYTLLHVAEINLENLPTPTLQEVTDAGNTTSNVIVGNNGFTTSDAHSNFEIATNYTTGTRQLNFYIEGDEVDFPTSTSSQISTNLDNGISFTSSVSGNTTGFFVNGFDQGVTIGGTSGKFALLKTGLISGGTKSFEFPNNSGTLALTSDLSSATTSVWKKSGLINNANLVNEKIYRQNSVNLIGSTVNFGTAPTQSDLDNEILGTQFGHIVGSGTVPFIQLLSNGSNGSAGTNNFIGRYTGAPTHLQQMTFSAIKSTAYDRWGDANRLLFKFQDGYLSPVSKFEIGTDYLRFSSYPSIRNDSGDTMTNILFTNPTGFLKSRPLTDVTGNLVTTNTTQTITGQKSFTNITSLNKTDDSVYPTNSGGGFYIGGNAGYYNQFNFISVDGSDGDGFGLSQMYSNAEAGNHIRHTNSDNDINASLNINYNDLYLRHIHNGKRTSIYIDGITDKVIIEGSQNSFAGLGTSLITEQRNFEFPNASGILPVYNLTSETSMPSSSSDTGSKGEFRYDKDNKIMYVCVDTDSWVKYSVETW